MWKDDAWPYHQPASRWHALNYERIATGTYLDHILNLLAEDGSSDAFITRHGRISRSMAGQIVFRLAQALGGHGAGKGVGIAVLAGNKPETVLIQLAIHLLGCRLILVPVLRGRGELAAYIDKADASFLVFDPDYSDSAFNLKNSTRLRQVFSFGSPRHADDLLKSTVGSPVVPPCIAVRNEEITTLFYTGGTWGHPKIVTHSHAFYDSFIPGGHNESDGDRLLICTQVTHGSGLFASLDAMAAGVTIALIDEFDAETVMRIIKKAQITSVVLNPPMLYELLDHPAWPDDGFPDLARVHYAGGPIAPARLRQAIARFGPILRQVYGMAETGGITALEPGDHDPSRLETLRRCGKPIPGVEVRVCQEDHVVTAPGAIGEVVVCGQKIMNGYWGDPELTRTHIVDGWFRTGDLGFWDEQGYLCLVGRIRDVITHWQTSFNVYCRLLDDFLHALPGVLDAAAIGVPDERYGEAVYVFLVAHPGHRLSTGTIRRWIVEELGPLYDPRGFSFLDKIPLTPAGKVDKKALQHLAFAAGGPRMR
jgi:fatty-acyl-CoA synthase